jgi:hypothetical protein
VIWRLIVCLLCLGLAAAAFAEACRDRPANTLELEVEGFGTLYFSEADTRVQLGEIDLGGGVCVDLGGGNELQSRELIVRNFPMNPVFMARGVTLQVDGWSFAAEQLEATDTAVSLTAVTFTGAVYGRAAEILMDIPTMELTMASVTAFGQGFQVGARRAEVTESTIIFEEALMTTCLCQGGRALYVVRAQRAEYSVADARFLIRNGILDIGILEIALEDVELSEAALASLTFPLTIEYVTDNGETGARGTGLGIRIPRIPLDDETTLELGVTGLDVDYPLNGVLLFRHRSQLIDFEIGKAATGPQADFTLRHPLAPWLTAALTTTNRHWQAQDFLHEGKVSLLAEHIFNLAGHRLTTRGQLFAAASSQTVGQQPIQGTRLGISSDLLYQSPAVLSGRFSVRLRTDFTLYPQQQLSQQGLYVEPRYQGRIGPVSVDANLRWQWTNSASPFSTRLDRLEPFGDVGVSLQWEQMFSEAVRGSFRVSTRYDFLKGDPVLTQNISQLSALVNLTWVHENLTVNPYISANLAAYFNDALAVRQRPFLEGGLNLSAETWEVGFLARVNPREQFGLEKIELNTSFPIPWNEFVFQPYLALDILPTLLNNELPRVSGHGLEVTWASCCGTLIVGYRQQENAFSTSLGFRLGD